MNLPESSLNTRDDFRNFRSCPLAKTCSAVRSTSLKHIAHSWIISPILGELTLFPFENEKMSDHDLLLPRRHAVACVTPTPSITTASNQKHRTGEIQAQPSLWPTSAEPSLLLRSQARQSRHEASQGSSSLRKLHDLHFPISPPTGYSPTHQVICDDLAWKNLQPFTILKDLEGRQIHGPDPSPSKSHRPSWEDDKAVPSDQQPHVTDRTTQRRSTDLERPCRMNHVILSGCPCAPQRAPFQPKTKGGPQITLNNTTNPDPKSPNSPNLRGMDSHETSFAFSVQTPMLKLPSRHSGVRTVPPLSPGPRLVHALIWSLKPLYTLLTASRSPRMPTPPPVTPVDPLATAFHPLPSSPQNQQVNNHLCPPPAFLATSLRHHTSLNRGGKQ